MYVWMLLGCRFMNVAEVVVCCECCQVLNGILLPVVEHLLNNWTVRRNCWKHSLLSCTFISHNNNNNNNNNIYSEFITRTAQFHIGIHVHVIITTELWQFDTRCWCVCVCGRSWWWCCGSVLSLSCEYGPRVADLATGTCGVGRGLYGDLCALWVSVNIKVVLVHCG